MDSQPTERWQSQSSLASIQHGKATQLAARTKQHQPTLVLTVYGEEVGEVGGRAAGPYLLHHLGGDDDLSLQTLDAEGLQQPGGGGGDGL